MYKMTKVQRKNRALIDRWLAGIGAMSRHFAEAQFRLDGRFKHTNLLVDGFIIHRSSEGGYL